MLDRDDGVVTFSVFRETPLTDFYPVLEQSVREIIAQCPSKMCDLNPLPASLFNACIDDLVPSITTSTIINFSLSSGTVPDQFKYAIVTPLLKKYDLDPECLKPP